MRNKVKKICCENCSECVYICEGDFICTDDNFENPEIVLTDFSVPTDEYMRCKNKEKIEDENN